MIAQERGTSGFFEEIILFAVVSVLFVSTLVMAAYFQSVKSTEYEKEELVNEVYSFVAKVREYQPLIHDGVEGLFDYHKIKSVTYEDLKRDLTPKFNFMMKVIDTSNYKQKISQQWGNLNDSFGYYRVVVIYPADIWVSDHEIHTAKIEVVAWE
jgi:hypothetical protein